MKETLPTSAKISDPVPQDGIRYRTLFIVPKRDFGGQPHLIKGRAVMAGFVVTDGICNVMPAATWFETIEEAKHGIDVLIAVKGDSDSFWEIMQPYQDTPGEKSEHCYVGRRTCGRHYSTFENGVCVDVGYTETAPTGMKIIVETERTKSGTSFMLIEDDGTEDGGRIVARLYRHEEVLAVCKAMGWTITSDAWADPKRRTA